MIENDGIFLRVNGFLKPVLQAEIGASVYLALEHAILYARPKVLQNFGDLVAPLIVGNVVDDGVVHGSPKIKRIRGVGWKDGRVEDWGLTPVSLNMLKHHRWDGRMEGWKIGGPSPPSFHPSNLPFFSSFLKKSR